MNIVTIGDTHGGEYWTKAPSADITVFVGDYTDHWTRKDIDIMANLTAIMDLKRSNPDNVILLFGNHDVQYALSPPGSNDYRCSGYRPMMHWDLYPIFRDNFDLFQFAYEHDNYLWTHAGVHRGWYTQRYLKEDINEDLTLAENLNELFSKKADCLFDVGHIRGGYRQVGGPLWLHTHPVRKYLEGYHQIVGHTIVKTIRTEKFNDDTSVTFVDCFENKEEFYTINL